MKFFHPIVAGLLVLALAGAVQAGPLKQNQVAADARWVAHIDVDRLLKTELGQYVGREFLDKKLAKPAARLKRDADVDFDWRRVHSITAYGWDFKGKNKANGVLIFHTDMDVPAALDQVITKLEAQLGANEPPLRKTEELEGGVYQFEEEVFGAGAKGGVFVLTRSKGKLLEALRVLSGGARSLAASKSMSGLEAGGAGDAFLLLGVAEGFTDNAALPKQVDVLKQASGGRLMAGERAEKVFVSVALDTKTAETAVQIQQLVQGLIALATLNAEANPDLKTLAQGAKVEGREKQVTLALEMPVKDVISQVAKAGGSKRSAE